MNTSPANQAPRQPLILNVEDRDGPRYVKSRILNRADFSVLEASNVNKERGSEGEKRH